MRSAHALNRRTSGFLSPPLYPRPRSLGPRFVPLSPRRARAFALFLTGLSFVIAHQVVPFIPLLLLLLPPTTTTTPLHNHRETCLSTHAIGKLYLRQAGALRRAARYVPHIKRDVIFCRRGRNAVQKKLTWEASEGHERSA